MRTELFDNGSSPLLREHQGKVYLALNALLNAPARGRTFAQCVRSVFDIHDLPLAAADAYFVAFSQRYHWLLDEHVTFFSECSLLFCVHEWAMQDTFGVTGPRGDALIRATKLDLYFAVTGINPLTSTTQVSGYPITGLRRSQIDPSTP